MQPTKLNLNDLSVDSFRTTSDDPFAAPADEPNFLLGNNAAMECTGCVSGCGIFPNDPAF
ncbi:MAG: hypothetical protein JWM27_4066 [Gemmatimonadetes bacterium]|nr:hypothetical protein [Gemmatimonadota bacterium]